MEDCERKVLAPESAADRVSEIEKELLRARSRAVRPGRTLAAMTMPIELPDEVARRVLAMARARGVRPEQVVIEAVQAEVGSGDADVPDNPFSSVQDDLRQIAFDGSLRAEIDSWVDDPDLAVG
jgi:hypothetical protein